MFKIGDFVECLDNSRLLIPGNLTIGTTYKVTYSATHSVYVMDNSGQEGGYINSRFKLATMSVSLPPSTYLAQQQGVNPGSKFRIGDKVIDSLKLFTIEELSILNTYTQNNGLYMCDCADKYGNRYTYKEYELYLSIMPSSNSNVNLGNTTQTNPKFQVGDIVRFKNSSYSMVSSPTVFEVIKYISSTEITIQEKYSMQTFDVLESLVELASMSMVTSVNGVTGSVTASQLPKAMVGLKFKVGDRVNYKAGHNLDPAYSGEEAEIIQVGVDLFGHANYNYYIQFDYGVKVIALESEIAYIGPIHLNNTQPSITNPTPNTKVYCSDGNVYLGPKTDSDKESKSCTCSSKDLFSKGCTCGAVQKKNWGI